MREGDGFEGRLRVLLLLLLLISAALYLKALAFY